MVEAAAESISRNRRHRSDTVLYQCALFAAAALLVRSLGEARVSAW